MLLSPMLPLPTAPPGLALSFSSLLHCTPAVVSLLVYLGAGFGYALVASKRTDDACGSARAHYLATHTVSPRIETALRRGNVATGMTPRQVSLARGVPRTRVDADNGPVWVYDARDARTPGWLRVTFDEGRVAALRRVPASETSLLPPATP